MDDVILDWLSDTKGSVRVSHDLKIPQYTLVGWEQTLQVQEYSTGTIESPDASSVQCDDESGFQLSVVKPKPKLSLQPITLNYM